MNFTLEEFEIHDSKERSIQPPVEKVDQRKHSEPENVLLKNPLNKIALCLSGGGFRAASFGLGALSYLNRRNFGDKTLLDHVSYISSASGGTITASMYALSIGEKDYSFDKFYDKMLKVLHGDTLLTTALTILNDNKAWKNDKSRNLINAFALAYDKLLYHQAEFGRFYRGNLRVCFNATEFYRGLSFRFQNHGYLGNQYINLDKTKRNITSKIKVSDVLAASSCFPAGFEPINFPDDFAHDRLTKEELQQTVLATDYRGDSLKNPTIPLMDGGVTDNQGLNSAILADLVAREDGKEPIDLFVVTDVASYFMHNYKTPALNGSWWLRIKINTLVVLTSVLGLTGFACAVTLLLNGSSVLMKFLGGFLFFPSLVIVVWLLVSFIRALWYRLNGKYESFAGLRNTLNLNESFSDNIFKTLRNFFGKSRLNVLEQMIKNRLGSVVTMVSDINLKHVRRLINELFYNNDLFDNRRCSNYIYNYSEMNSRSTEKKLGNKNWPEEYKKLLMPCPRLQRIAEEARNMGTTLWFDKNDVRDEKMKNIITCGEITTCGSLLEYVLDLKYVSGLWNGLDEPVRNDLERLKDNLVTDWKAFNADPV